LLDIKFNYLLPIDKKASRTNPYGEMYVYSFANIWTRFYKACRNG